MFSSELGGRNMIIQVRLNKGNDMTTWSRSKIKEMIFGKEDFKIFLLEDNQMFLESLKMSLSNTFANGVKLSAYNESNSLIDELKNAPDVLVMDYYLDEKSEVEGIELIKYVREKCPFTQIIVLTGEKKIEKAKACYNEGVTNYITKDVNSIRKVMQEIIYKKDLAETA